MSKLQDFQDLHKNYRTFQAWNQNFQIPGLQVFKDLCKSCTNRGMSWI